MSFSLTRLTLYGALASIDVDLRRLIRQQVLGSKPLKEVLSDELFGKLKMRAEADGAVDEVEFIDFLDLGDSIGVLNRNKGELQPSTLNLVKKHTKSLMSAVPIRNRVMHCRPLHFTDVTAIQELEKLLLSFPKDMFPATREFSEYVSKDPFFPFTLDISELRENVDDSSHNLPVPDFDETGFLGREQETTQLLAACKQAWPIITIVAEGGFGKTALALKIAYELLDDPDKPFDYFVWTSSKTSQLTLTDIESIDGAISTSLGLFQDLSSKLSGIKTEDKCIDEVLSYLNEFKIFLVIDNLETILDDRIRAFFRRLTGKSKILVTSRVSPGEMVYPFPIGGLAESEAVQLLRSTAKVRRVPDLIKAKNDVLRGYCAKMLWNPGFIKWFVSSVQCGKRPEEVLVNPKIFLKFSVTNVYNYVSEDSKRIAKAMLAVPGRHSQPVLSYLTGMEGDQFQTALQQLWSANLIGMDSIVAETGYETTYELKELPRFFILQNHGLKAEEASSFQRRKRELSTIHERLEADQTNRYELRYIARRNKDDTVVAKLLADALKASARKNYTESLELVGRAKALDPAFFEVYRIEALVQNWSGNYAAAMEAYEIATSCAPNWAPLRYWYGGFLLREVQDIEGASKQLLRARELDPHSVQIALELARARMYGGEFSEADEALRPVLKSEEISMLAKRKAYDVWLQIALRSAAKQTEKGDFEKALQTCEVLIERFDEIPENYVDDKILETARTALPTLGSLVGRLTLDESQNRIHQCMEQLRALQPGLPARLTDNNPNKIFSPPDDSDIGKRLDGSVYHLMENKKSGFILWGDDRSIYFNFSNLNNGGRRINVGTKVQFTVVKVNDKFRAATIIVIPAVIDEDRLIKGVIKNVPSGKNFGFIFGDDSSEYFFHITALEGGAKLEMLNPGVRVSFEVVKGSDGTVAHHVHIVE